MAHLDDLAAFAAVVRHGTFTRAAAHLGVTPSALSHAIGGLEKRLELKLLYRTTRSVAPTEAGERLFRVLAPRLADIDAELAALRELRGRPAGSVRITASEHAVTSVLWPRLAPWLRDYPEIRVEIASDNRFVDIVAERYDIGVRLGADVARDMVAIRIAPDMRMAVVGASAYFARHGRPETPAALTRHACLSLRLPTQGGLMPWEFLVEGRFLTVHVQGPLVFSQSLPIVRAALDGYGLAWVPADLVQDAVAVGRLETVLDEQAAIFPGYHLYYASRRASRAIELVVEALRLDGRVAAG